VHLPAGSSTLGNVAVRPDTFVMPVPAAADQSAEELGLWADYYEAVSRAQAIVRAGGITPAAFQEVVAANSRANATLARIRQLRGPEA
jgi:hypothetical protein